RAPSPPSFAPRLLAGLPVFALRFGFFMARPLRKEWADIRLTKRQSLDQRFCGLHHGLGGDAEMLEQRLGGGTGAEAVHADEAAMRADPAVPTVADAGFHRHFGQLPAQHV